MTLATGTHLGPYEILAPLGAGGMGEVYRARDTRLDRTVAIKVLPGHLSASPELQRRLEREAKAISQLSHPHICTLHDVGREGEVDFLVMEYLEGETLASRLEKGPLPLEQALRAASEIADALDKAHRQGVVHRDLKPGNVMLTKSGAKLLDFGLAKLRTPGSAGEVAAESALPTEAHPLTEEGKIVGTYPYMAPEQLEGETADARTDIFAFGAVLYEMVTGQRAFEGKSRASLIAAILERDPPPVSTVQPLSPPGLDHVVKRCLAKDVEDRWHSAHDVKIELEWILEGGSRTTDGSAPKPRRSRPWVPWLAVPAAGACVLAALWLGARMGPVGPEPSTEIRQKQLTANPIENPVITAAVSPDGSYLAYADLSGLFIRLVDTGETHQVSLPDGFQITDVDWFPAGTDLLFTAVVDGVRSLWKIPILGGDPRRVRDGVWRAAVSPDGALIAYLEATTPPRTIYVAGPDGESPRKLVEGGPGDMISELAWSPDSRRLGYGRWHSGPEGRELTIESAHLSSGQTTVTLSDSRLFQDWRGVLPFCWTPNGRLVYARRGSPPNQARSNLWTRRIDIDSGSPLGPSSRLTDFAGYNFKDLTVTADGKRLAYLLERNQLDVHVGELADEGARLLDVRRLTLDDRDDRPATWMPNSREVLFHSNRGGAWALFRQALEGTAAERLVSTGEDPPAGAAATPDGSWILYWASQNLMKMPAAGGPSELVLTASSWIGEDETFRGFRCGRTPGSQCVLGERQKSSSEQGDGPSQYVFSSFDPVTGRGEELARVEDRPPFTAWDLSPDGSRVALVHRDNRIRIIQLQDGTETELSADGWMLGETVAWSADGTSLFIDGGPLQSTVLKTALLNVTLEEDVRVLRHRVNDWHVWPVASPDGRYLAFGIMTFSGNVMMLEEF